MTGRSSAPTASLPRDSRRAARLALPAMAMIIAGGVVGLMTKTPDGHTTLLMPSMGFVAMWLRLFVGKPRWWADAAFWQAAAAISSIPPIMMLVSGVPLAYALPRGPGALIQGLVSALVWVALDQGEASRDLRPLAKMWRLLVAVTVGSVADIPFAPVVLESLRNDSFVGVWLWILRGAISSFVVIVIVLGLQPPRRDVLAAPSRGIAAIVVLVSCGAYVIGFQQPHSLYLLLPPTIWAASVFTVRGVALHSTLVVVATTIAAAQRVGPFHTGGTDDVAFTGTTFMLVVVFVAMALVQNRETRESLVIDIEARRKAAASQAELLHTLVSSVGDAVVIVDMQGRPMMSNTAIIELSRGTAGSLEALLSAPAADGSVPLRRVLGGADSQLVDVRLTAPDGTEAVVALRVFALRHGEGTRAVVFAYDVTPERRRTADLRSFAHTIAHDLRNPVAGICMAAELGLDGVAAGDIEEAHLMLDRILRTGDRLTSLINDIMDYRVTSGSTLVRGPERVDEIVHRVAETRRAAVGQERLRLCIDAPVFIDVDRRLIERVFDNLLGNAVKYAVPGQDPSVDITARDIENGWVRIDVEDRGVGLPPGEEDKVFQPHHRVPEHALMCSGTGIGLAICRELVQRHGGRISAMPRDGGGTKFEIVLPSVVRRSAAFAARSPGRDAVTTDRHA